MKVWVSPHPQGERQAALRSPGFPAGLPRLLRPLVRGRGALDPRAGRRRGRPRRHRAGGLPGRAPPAGGLRRRQPRRLALPDHPAPGARLPPAHLGQAHLHPPAPRGSRRPAAAPAGSGRRPRTQERTSGSWPDHPGEDPRGAPPRPSCCSRSRGCSGDEIARIQSVPLNTVWTRLYHARKEFLALAAKFRKAQRGGGAAMRRDDDPSRLADDPGLDPWIVGLLRSTEPYTGAAGAKAARPAQLRAPEPAARAPRLLRPAIVARRPVGCGAFASAALGPWRGWIGAGLQRVVPSSRAEAPLAVAERARGHQAVAAPSPAPGVPSPAPGAPPPVAAPPASPPAPVPARGSSPALRPHHLAPLVAAPPPGEQETQAVLEAMRALRLDRESGAGPRAAGALPRPPAERRARRGGAGALDRGRRGAPRRRRRRPGGPLSAAVSRGGLRRPGPRGAALNGSFAGRDEFLKVGGAWCPNR